MQDVRDPRVATGIVVRDRRDRILVLRRGPDAATGAGEWAIPGGKLDPGETLAACAARELLEETGIVAENVRRMPMITEDMQWGPALHFVTHYFLAPIWHGEPRIMEPIKHTAIDWLDRERIEAAVISPDPALPLFGPLRDLARAGGLQW